MKSVLHRQQQQQQTIAPPCLVFLLLFFACSSFASLAFAHAETTTTNSRSGSRSNPFHHKGCFAQMAAIEATAKEETATATESAAQEQQHNNNNYVEYSRRVRVCHSQDPPKAAAQGDCQIPDQGLDYTEIRIITQNWESTYMEAWILQIVLSEVLNVPVTIESGAANVVLDFYHNDDKDDNDDGSTAMAMSLGYGTANDWQALERAQAHGGDCRVAPKFHAQTGTYQPCGHVIPEVWVNHLKRVQELQTDNVVEPPTGLGVVGHQAWYIPKYTAARDPTLLTYLGLQGPGHRRTLADTFHRPTTWHDYCQQVSLTRCAVPDGVAKRPPQTNYERQRLHVPGLYIGHFRATQENDCDKWPENCTGHIADFPCGWLSNVEQQTHHLNIALSSSGPQPGARGWSYTQLLEMWAAANATRSDIMMQWWSPEASLYQQFLHTDAELQVVSLPPPTQSCIHARIDTQDRCDQDAAVRRGSPEGACMEPPYPLQKVISRSLHDITQHDSIPLAKRSPAYDAVKGFTISALQLGDLFDKWLTKKEANSDGIDNSGLDLRMATCEWLVEHWDQIEPQVVPRTFPRVSQIDEARYRHALFYVAVGVASVALVAVVVTAVLTYRTRHRQVIRHAQVEFLFLLLAGLLLVSLGALVSVLPPTNATCVTTIWLTNVGYTLELVPLIVKVAAIHKLMSAARQMKRIVLNRKDLFGMVFGLCGLVVIFLALWSILDAPRRDTIYSLSGSHTNRGETIVFMNYYCQSDSDYWRYLSALWHSLLLLTATVLAFQTRRLRTDFNETQTLALMIYSHFVFVVLRIITFSLESGENEADIVRYRSLIFSCDAITTIVVYFCTKLLAKENGEAAASIMQPMGAAASAQSNPSSQWCLNSGLPLRQNRRGLGNTPGLASANSSILRTSSVARTPNESSYHRRSVPSIQEASNESGNELSDDDDDNVDDDEEQKSDEDASLDDEVERRLQSYLAHNAATGLRCRQCGKTYPNLASQGPEEPKTFQR